MTNVTAYSKKIHKEKVTLTYLLSIVFILVMADISLELFEGMPLEELAYALMLESSILIVVFFATNFVWKKFAIEKENCALIEKDLIQVQELANSWERKSKQYVQEFQGFILHNFSEWGLTKSEREIAHFILKGSSSKEIAAHRFTSERTIRNQCRPIYEKSKLNGKNEFSAFFLDELLSDFSV